jgi:hypothetical protein
VVTGAYIAQFLTSFYYFLFLVVFWPVYVICRMVMEKRSWKVFVHPALAAGLVTFVVVAIWYIRPFLLMQSEYHVERSVEQNIVYSAGPADYLFTTPENETYGGLASLPMFSVLRGKFAGLHPYEHSVFPGIIACIFFVASILLIRKKQLSPAERRVMAVYLLLALLAILLTFGPYVTALGVRVPFLYALFYWLPGADTLRVPTRFVVIALFALSILVVYVWKQVEETYGKRMWVLPIVVIVLLCFEYRYTFPAPTPVPADIQKFYSVIDSRSDIRVIVELPIGNGYKIGNILLGRDFIKDSTYLLYALYHTKTLVNGYHGFIPPDYYALGRMTGVGFPTPEKIAALKDMGVDALIVHLEQYPVPDIGENLVKNLRQLGLTEIGHTESIYGFLTK